MLPICRSMSSWSRLPISRGRLAFDLSLYLVANRPSFQDETLFFSKIISAVKGGVSCVQFRDHKSDLSVTIRTALRLKNMLQGVPLFINTLEQLWGMERLRNVRTIIPHRIVAIGGLNLSCVEPVYRELRSDDGIAMAGGLMDEEAPNITAQKIQSIRQKIREER